MENQKNTLTLQKASSTLYKMIIPTEVESKIRFLCAKVYNIEWSGILFYDYKGSFEENNLEIICKDIFLMDIGNSVYTEFNLSNPEVCTYAIDNNLLDYQVGLIHSHHSMGTTFSGTDMNTLLVEGTDRNVFVSLIVNNAGTYSAKITRKIKSNITEEKSYRTFKDVLCSKVNDSYVKEYVEYFDLNIEKQNESFQYLEDKINEIKKSKEAERANKSIISEHVGIEQNGQTYLIDPNKQSKNNLFTGYEDDYNNYGLLDEDNNKDPYLNYKETTIKEENDLVNLIITKLFTGDITATMDKYPNLLDTYADMEKRFNGVFDDIVDFENWADRFIDFIIETYAGKINKDTLKDWASQMSYISTLIIDGLMEYEYNAYINVYQNILQNYLD